MKKVQTKPKAVDVLYMTGSTATIHSVLTSITIPVA